MYVFTKVRFLMARKNPALHRALSTEGVELMSRQYVRVVTPKSYIYIYIHILTIYSICIYTVYMIDLHL